MTTIDIHQICSALLHRLSAPQAMQVQEMQMCKTEHET